MIPAGRGLRPLSVLESLLFCDANASVSPMNIVLCVRLRGAMPRERLSAAIDEIFQRHPLLGARVTQTAGHAEFVAADGAGIRLREATRGSEWHWLDEATREIDLPFDVRQGPLARFVWLRGDGQHEIMVVIHHGIAEGLAGLLVLDEILTLLAGEPLPAAPPLPLPAPRMLRPEVTRRVSVRMAASLLGFALETACWLGSRAGSAAGPPRPRAHYALLREWSEPATRGLLARCRAEQVSLTTATATALAQELWRVAPSGRNASVSVPVNIRPRLHAQAQRAVGMYMVPLKRVPVRMPRNGSLWDDARRFKSTLKRHAGDPRLVAPLLAIEAVGPALRNLRQREVTDLLTCSSLGQITLRSRDALAAEAVYGLGSTYGAERLAVFATCAGRLSLCFVSTEEALPRAAADRALDAAVAALT